MSQTPKLPYWNLEVSTIPRCNMACSYCFEGEELQSKKSQSRENIVHIVKTIEDLLSDERFQKEYESIRVNLWGGEPTLAYNWNKELIETLATKDYWDRVSFFMYSNGYDFDRVVKHLNIFVNSPLGNQLHKFKIQISWDGFIGDRIDHKGANTHTRVKENILRLALFYPDLDVSVKATLPLKYMLDLPNIWDEFYDLHNKVQKLNPKNFVVTYSPTIDYTTDYDVFHPDSLNNKSKELEATFKIIAKKEILFYKKYGYHLFGWFSETLSDLKGRRLFNCSAGVHMAMVNIDNEVLACHGALYPTSKQSKDIFLKQFNTKITDPDFKDVLFKTRDQLKKQIDRVDDSCKTCSATVCYKCPIVNVEEKLKTDTPTNDNFVFEQFQSRDPRHCEIYKIFGNIDRSVWYHTKIQGD